MSLQRNNKDQDVFHSCSSGGEAKQQESNILHDKIHEFLKQGGTIHVLPSYIKNKEKRAYSEFEKKSRKKALKQSKAVHKKVRNP